MKLFIALAVVFVGLCVLPESEAFWGWGWGGYGGFYSPMYGGYGYGGWGWPYYRYYRDTMVRGDISKRVQCKYYKEKSVLSCSDQTGVVDCGVTANFTGIGKHQFELFGLANTYHAPADQPIELVKYKLYPRLMDNSAWWNHTFVVDGKPVSLSLFHSYTYNTNYGYRVVDYSCYERFVNLFRNVDKEDYESVPIVNETGVPVRNVTLFGEILCDAKVKI